MQSKMILKLLVMFVLLSVSLFAIEGKVKVFIKSNEAIYTSQKMTVSVEILSDALSMTDTKIVFSPSTKYIVQTPKSAAYLQSVEMNGTTWQMVHYDYEVYAMEAGKIEIPSLLVSFSASMGYGQPKKEFSLKSDTLIFDVKAPPGFTSSAFVLVTKKYALDYTLTPKKTKLIIGDAVRFEVTQKAQGVPDILLKPMLYTSNAHVRVYSKEAVLKSGLKGDYDVSRKDSFTLVANAEGNVTFSAQKVTWWNSQSKTVVDENIPALHFEIIADPQIAIDAKREAQKEFMFKVILLVLLGLGLFWLGKKYLPQVLQWLKKMKISANRLDKKLNP